MIKLVAGVLACVFLPLSQTHEMRVLDAVVPTVNQVWNPVPWDDSMAPRRITKKQKTTKFSLETRIVAHPEGCPRTKFCGCGVSERVYGKKIRSLYLAANWLKFPRANPAPGMVAARRGHVFYIEAVLSKNRVIAYDPNSGGRKTRIHVRSLAGFRVVNPTARL